MMMMEIKYIEKIVMVYGNMLVFQLRAWIEAFLDRTEWIKRTRGVSKSYDLEGELNNMHPHLVGIWGLMRSLGQDPGKDLMNTDPTLICRFFLRVQLMVNLCVIPIVIIII
eukprot:491304_1